MMALRQLGFLKVNFRREDPAEEDHRVLALFRNRAELKKAYGELQEEIYRLKDRIKQQEGATQRVQEMLGALEGRLGFSETRVSGARVLPAAPAVADGARAHREVRRRAGRPTGRARAAPTSCRAQSARIRAAPGRRAAAAWGRAGRGGGGGAGRRARGPARPAAAVLALLQASRSRAYDLAGARHGCCGRRRSRRRARGGGADRRRTGTRVSRPLARGAPRHQYRGHRLCRGALSAAGTHPAGDAGAARRPAIARPRTNTAHAPSARR